MEHIAERFFKSKWGVFNHFLSYDCENAEEWNEKVNKYDVKKVAKQLHDMGAHYYFITIMQGRKFMIAPNETYNRITGYKPGEACAKRDVIKELIEELPKYGIDLYLYYTGDGPHLDEQAGKALGYYDADNPMWKMGEDGKYHLNEAPQQVSDAFLEKWTSVLEEYAVRYGSGVNGWWIDGMYDYIGYNEENIEYYKRAVKKGNPDAIVCFNNGVKGEKEENWGRGDFISGESNDFSHIPDRRFVNGAQNHKLITLGFDPDFPGCDKMVGWGKKGLLCSKEFLYHYMKRANQNGAVITLDIAVEDDGSFDPEQMEALKYIEGKN